jgi:Etoposide-induced protein 2.4 (EI24)
MNLLFDSFWRAVAYCMHPRVILMSLLPLVVIAAVVAGLSYFFWVPAFDAVNRALEASALLQSAWMWLDKMGLSSFKTVLPMLVVLAVATPVIVVVCLLAVTLCMMPVIVKLVARRRFPTLVVSGGASLWASLVWSVGSAVLALLALVLSIPLWLIPPLVFIVPPLIWGWLTYRVMAFDVLADHATATERTALLRQHRWALLGMGVMTGYLSAAPSLIWSMGMMTLVMAPFLVLVSIWIYMLVFAFSALWFTHYGLAALHAMRAQQAAAPELPTGAV